MKKVIMIVASCIFLLQAMTCKKQEKGYINVEGYIMKQCGSDQPERNSKVSFGIGSTELLSTTTNEFGYFHLEGEYDFDVCIQCGYDNNYLAFQGDGGANSGYFRKEFACNLSKNTNLDTVYMDNSMLVKFEILTAGQPIGSLSDTLYIEFPLPYYERTPEKSMDVLKIPGPFTNHMTSNTVLSMAPRHVGFLCSWAHAQNQNINFYYGYSLNYDDQKVASVEFVNGQPNNSSCGSLQMVSIDLSK
jgi:hypothetical protein